MLENIPQDESRQIQTIVDLTLQQLQQRYISRGSQVLRGVHAKGHGCVNATFAVLPDIAENLRHEVFAQPGKKYSAQIRFSNANPLVEDDSTAGSGSKPPVHGSRGMAIKIIGIDGPLLPTENADRVQDFLMINQPVFAFANVEDYEVLSQVLVDDKDNPAGFFAKRLPAPGTSPSPSQHRALETLGIVGRIRSASATATPPAYQAPPASPVDNDYFGASPFRLGPDQVMRFRARALSRSTAEPDATDGHYLRKALVQRLRDIKAGDVVFHFEIQVRAASSISPDDDIENASNAWPDTIPFIHVATLTIPLQEFDTEEFQERCERLEFTPWHGLEAHQPLGGINRLRRAIYEASSQARRVP